MTNNLVLLITRQRVLYIPKHIEVVISHISAPSNTSLLVQHAYGHEFSDLRVIARINEEGIQRMNIRMQGPDILNFVCFDRCKLCLRWKRLQ